MQHRAWYGWHRSQYHLDTRNAAPCMVRLASFSVSLGHKECSTVHGTVGIVLSITWTQGMQHRAWYCWHRSRYHLDTRNAAPCMVLLASFSVSLGHKECSTVHGTVGIVLGITWTQGMQHRAWYCWHRSRYHLDTRNAAPCMVRLASFSVSLDMPSSVTVAIGLSFVLSCVFFFLFSFLVRLLVLLCTSCSLFFSYCCSLFFYLLLLLSSSSSFFFVFVFLLLRRPSSSCLFFFSLLYIFAS